MCDLGMLDRVGLFGDFSNLYHALGWVLSSSNISICLRPWLESISIFKGDEIT